LGLENFLLGFRKRGVLKLPISTQGKSNGNSEPTVKEFLAQVNFSSAFYPLDPFFNNLLIFLNMSAVSGFFYHISRLKFEFKRTVSRPHWLLKM
jgi:hypothetical protein